MKNEFLKNWEIQMKKGLLPFYVLQVLREKTCYGYELIQELNSRYDIEVTEGTIYPLLIRLMKEGLLEHQWVEQTSGIPRKYYAVSANGQQNFKDMEQSVAIIFKKITS